MKLIALEASGLVAGVAIYEDGVIKAEYETCDKQTHSQTLLPMLEELQNRIHLDLHSVDAIAISNGPGSFTGLRIGSATAKGLGLALNIPIVEVPTLEGLAYNLWGTDSVVCPIMDARRQQVYSAAYVFADHGEALMHTVLEPGAIPVSELVMRLNELGRKVIFVGDGIPVYREKLDGALNIPHDYAPADRARQRAGSIAMLGVHYYNLGKAIPAADSKPEYLRESQAEREGPPKRAEAIV